MLLKVVRRVVPKPIRSGLLRPLWLALTNPCGRSAFLRQLHRAEATPRILDVGCGNDSPLIVKSELPGCNYTGLDIDDYNQSSAHMADRYVRTSPEAFAATIRELRPKFDGVICSHNLEHCDDRTATLDAMISVLRPGAWLYLAFPCADSVSFPSRAGTLNYYDDSSHKGTPPEFDLVVSTLRRAGLRVPVAVRRNRPAIRFVRGLLQERSSRRSGKLKGDTWALYGFESIIWAQRPDAM
jgi:SAM-dependent methyltransferase